MPSGWLGGGPSRTVHPPPVIITAHLPTQSTEHGTGGTVIVSIVHILCSHNPVTSTVKFNIKIGHATFQMLCIYKQIRSHVSGTQGRKGCDGRLQKCQKM